ncbi:hypothetical protein PYCC9005_003882 [Savitreella phatthalungensis]
MAFAPPRKPTVSSSRSTRPPSSTISRIPRSSPTKPPPPPPNTTADHTPDPKHSARVIPSRYMQVPVRRAAATTAPDVGAVASVRRRVEPGSSPSKRPAPASAGALNEIDRTIVRVQTLQMMGSARVGEVQLGKVSEDAERKLGKHWDELKRMHAASHAALRAASFLADATELKSLTPSDVAVLDAGLARIDRLAADLAARHRELDVGQESSIGWGEGVERIGELAAAQMTATDGLAARLEDGRLSAGSAVSVENSPGSSGVRRRSGSGGHGEVILPDGSVTTLIKQIRLALHAILEEAQLLKDVAMQVAQERSRKIDVEYQEALSWLATQSIGTQINVLHA